MINASVVHNLGVVAQHGPNPCFPVNAVAPSYRETIRMSGVLAPVGRSA